MRYDFRCQKCELLVEHIQSIKDLLPEKLKCPRPGCDGKCVIVVSAPAIAHSGMTHEPFDVAVGRDAEARWADIRRRQDLRNKVRKESGEQALVMTGRNEFQPVKGAKLTPVVIGPDLPKGSGPRSKATEKALEDLKKKD
jgi:putative FmdB family regulatory protein